MGMSIRKKHIILPAIITLTGLVGGCFIWYGWMTPNSSKEASGVVLDWRYTEKIYPDIDTSKLSDTQKKIVSLTKQEYLAQSSGVKFSEGANEAWCADFVSWIMKEASMPLENPNSGSWRIPGTFTLQDYYVTAGRFMAVNSGYEPKLGDVAIYRGSPVFGDHANIILSNQNGVLTTVGGNEGNRIRVYVNTQKNYEGLLGYGTMEG
jgi:hypothetical protein